jgi:hypothetical protein
VGERPEILTSVTPREITMTVPRWLSAAIPNIRTSEGMIPQ